MLTRENVIRGGSDPNVDKAGGWEKYIEKSFNLGANLKEVIQTINDSETCPECREKALDYVHKIYSK